MSGPSAKRPVSEVGWRPPHARPRASLRCRAADGAGRPCDGRPAAVARGHGAPHAVPAAVGEPRYPAASAASSTRRATLTESTSGCRARARKAAWREPFAAASMADRSTSLRLSIRPS